MMLKKFSHSPDITGYSAFFIQNNDKISAENGKIIAKYNEYLTSFSRVGLT